MAQTIVNIRQAFENDLHTLARLALLLWPAHTLTELEEEFKDIMAGGGAFFILTINSQPAGFAQCQLRHDYVEGTKTSPVGYLEGIFVQEKYRGGGHARALLNACEQWAAARGCTEFASDCELSNDVSLQFHLNMGFEEAGRVICFVKRL